MMIRRFFLFFFVQRTCFYVKYERLINISMKNIFMKYILNTPGSFIWMCLRVYFPFLLIQKKMPCRGQIGQIEWRCDDKSNTMRFFYFLYFCLTNKQKEDKHIHKINFKKRNTITSIFCFVVYFGASNVIILSKMSFVLWVICTVLIVLSTLFESINLVVNWTMFVIFFLFRFFVSLSFVICSDAFTYSAAHLKLNWIVVHLLKCPSIFYLKKNCQFVHDGRGNLNRSHGKSVNGRGFDKIK